MHKAWEEVEFYEIKSSPHYNVSLTVNPVENDTNHFVSTLDILSVSEGEYTCYCYYNTLDYQYVTSNVLFLNTYLWFTCVRGLTM